MKGKVSLLGTHKWGFLRPASGFKTDDERRDTTHKYLSEGEGLGRDFFVQVSGPGPLSRQGWVGFWREDILFVEVKGKFRVC